jgi:hypothetical protein
MIGLLYMMLLQSHDQSQELGRLNYVDLDFFFQFFFNIELI